MSSHLSLLLVWTTLLLSIACTYTVHCSVLNSTGPENNVTVSGEGDHIADEVENAHELVHEEDGEDEDDMTIRDFIIDDSIRVQPVIKPENTEVTTKKQEKKKGNKKGQKKKNNKKKNPCQTTHENFCIHGECKYLASVQEVSCKCHQHYFGERCIERSMKSESQEQNDMTTTTVLAVVAVLLSTISIAAIIIIIVVHTRRKYSSYACDAEEKKKLGQENGSEDVDV
ncbi:amphiregulin [Mixophyes fleayi]|uniref:amphiregulin n=1 Tax=Mixophyes fleayi TaxID=3061075 RepID=UPI003F4E1E36